MPFASLSISDWTIRMNLKGLGIWACALLLWFYESLGFGSFRIVLLLRITALHSLDCPKIV